MSNFIVPNTFIPGTKAKAQEVNENFTSIQNELNTKATKTGDVTQPFFVAPAIEDNQATTKKQIEKIIEETKTELFSKVEIKDLCLFALSGNVSKEGKADLISFSDMNLNFLVGGVYPNLIGNIQGKTTSINSINSFSLNGYSDGTYNIFVNKNGEISVISNKIYIQPKEPTMVINDIWVNTSKYPNEIIQYNGSGKIPFENIFIGKVVIKNSQIESVLTNAYKSKMVTITNHTNSAQVIETYQNGSSGYRIYSDGFCEQWGYIAFGVNNSANAITRIVSFLKPFAFQPNVITQKGDINTTNLNYIGTAAWYNTQELVLNVTTTSFQTFVIDKYGYAGLSWRAIGYLANEQY